MKKTYKRRCMAMLLLIFLLSIFLPPGKAAAMPRYESSGYKEFMDDTSEGQVLYEQYKDALPRLPGGGSPPRFKTVQDTKLYINYRLWREQGILCYGNYAKVPGNDFKNSTQKPGQPAIKNEGYYLKDGGRGEYRYHGYDINGNPMTNLNFEPDSLVTKFNERAWIQDPWYNLSLDKAPKNYSIYNEAAIGERIYPDPSVKPGVQNWINKSLDQYGGVPLVGNVSDPEVYRYLYIESAPSLLGMGQGRMWHQYRDGSIWYQSIAVPQLTGKENLPVTAAIELLTDLPQDITDVGKDMDSREITLRFAVKGILQDEGIYDDPVKMTVYYTRHDIEVWDFTFSGPEQAVMTVPDAIATLNTGIAEFEYKTTYGFLKTRSSTVDGKTTWNLHFTASARPGYRDGKKGLSGNTAYDLGIGVVKPILPPATAVLGFAPDNRIPETAFDGIAFTALDNTDMSRVESRRVFVDGKEVSDSVFFSGSYIFAGTVGENGRFAYVDCEYKVQDIPGDAGMVYTRDIVYIYPTKPMANFKVSSNTWKENRIIKVQNTCDDANIQIVSQKYPIVQYEWSYGGDTSQLRKGIDTDLTKELLYKAPGLYSVTLRCKNSLGIWSEPYTVKFQVTEDLAPAIGVNLSGSIYTREDTVSAWYYFAGSTDGDIIKSSSIELWYDSNNDGTLDQKIFSLNNQEEFPVFTPGKLGYYKYIIKAQEDIVTDTLPRHITEADKKTSSYEVEFWVDNYRPMADIYVNIPVQRSNIDVFFMLDKNLDAARKDLILDNRINMSNWLLGRNIIPNLNIWDMKAYTYSQSAYTTKNTGNNYPPSTVRYSSGGYSGTLSLYDTRNNEYSVDEGSYSIVTESKTVSKDATNVNSATFQWDGGKWVLISKDEKQLPATMPYSDAEGYQGTLIKQKGVKTGEDDSPPTEPKKGDTYTYYSYWSVIYLGTVSRTLQIWVPQLTWYDDYTGYYSGTIHKEVRQPYTDPFNPTSGKYVVYISDKTISEAGELNMVMNFAGTAKLLLVGTPDIKNQRTHDFYFNPGGKSIESLMNEILNEIAENNPATEKFYLLQNQHFTMNVGQFDLEGDEITEKGMQYVHQPGYFDNPTGTEPGSVPVYNDTAGWIGVVKNSFENTGKYTVYRRVKDRPSTDPAFASYSYYSEPAFMEIYVVRKPIAIASLDWDFDVKSGVYKTAWKDKSYDPDHQYSRPDKGIVDRTIMWRREEGPWNYGIPDNLSAGSYELNYYVCDVEGYWSEPYLMNFTLDPAPTVQFSAGLKTRENRFSLAAVPASEELLAHDLRTRFPYDVRLEMAIYDGDAIVTPLKTIHFSSLTGVKSGNDIKWNDVVYKIPETLPDKGYEMRITAIAEGGTRETKKFGVNVVTPLELEPIIAEEVAGGTSVQLQARTAEYAGTVKVDLFADTPHEKTYFLTQLPGGGGGGTGIRNKNWAGSLPVSGVIADGNYKARFTAIAPNGTAETKELTFRLKSLGITGVSLTGYWNHWRGQTDVFGKSLTNEPHRFLSLECVKVDIVTIGSPDRVTIRFSPELEAMTYTDANGHTYSYKDDYFGYTVCFPEDSTFSGDSNHIYWEYHLPLAPSTKNWEDERQRQPYSMIVRAFKGDVMAEYIIDDIEITGNIYDLTYIQPVGNN